MRIAPRTLREWSSFVAFPFKAYITTAFVGLKIATFRFSIREDTSVIQEPIVVGYGLCFLALIFTSTIQLLCGQKAESNSSALFAGLALLFGFLSMLPTART